METTADTSLVSNTHKIPASNLVAGMRIMDVFGGFKTVKAVRRLKGGNVKITWTYGFPETFGGDELLNEEDPKA